MKVHLGCGEKIIEGYINVDIRSNLKCDVIDDVKTLSHFENNSVSEIYASHVLEHFNRHEYFSVLLRWYDVLSDKGILKISVPDIEKVMLIYKSGTKLRSLWGLLYGGQTYEKNFHYVGFDFETLKEDLEKIGFTDIRLWDWRKTPHSHIDDFSQCYLPHMDKDNGTLMSLNIMATKKL
jgi:predicted SAM-dependent methyltransferase